MALLDILRETEDLEDTIMSNLGLRPYTVYSRIITYSGDDLDKGIKGIATIVDTIISPKPKINGVSLGLVKKTGGYVEEGDFFFFLSAKNYTVSQIENFDGLVMDNKMYKIIRIDGYPDDMTPLQWKVLGRKVEGSEPLK